MILNLTKDQFILVKLILQDTKETIDKSMEHQLTQRDVNQAVRDADEIQAILDKMNR